MCRVAKARPGGRWHLETVESTCCSFAQNHHTKCWHQFCGKEYQGLMSLVRLFFTSSLSNTVLNTRSLKQLLAQYVR